MQTQLGSGIAVAMMWASSWSSDLNPSLGTCIYSVGVALKKKKEEETLLKLNRVELIGMKDQRFQSVLSEE